MNTRLNTWIYDKVNTYYRRYSALFIISLMVNIKELNYNYIGF